MFRKSKGNPHKHLSSRKQQRKKSRAQLDRFKKQLNVGDSRGELNMKSLWEIDMYA